MTHIIKTFLCFTIGLLLCLSQTSCKKSRKDTDTNFTISGTLKNIDSPYFLVANEDVASVNVDTVFVDSKGSFKYKGKAEDLQIVSLYFIDKSWSTSVFVNKDWNINIEGDINRPDLIMVKGGAVNDDLTSFKENNADLLNKKAEILLVDADSLNAESRQNGLTELKNIDFELTNRARQYIEKNPGKISSVILIQDFFKNNASLETLDEMLSLLTGDAAKYQLTSDLMKYSIRVKESRVGALAPAFKLINGKKTTSLSDFRGKYVYLFIGSCNPDFYTNSMDDLLKSYSLLKRKNIEFVSVFIDVPDHDFSHKTASWPVFYDKDGWASPIIKDYNIHEIPYGILISPEARILERKLYPTDVVEVMDSIASRKK